MGADQLARLIGHMAHTAQAIAQQATNGSGLPYRLVPLAASVATTPGRCR